MAFFSPNPDDIGPPADPAQGRQRLLARRARFSRWDGSQTVPDLDADEILDELADDLMSDGDLASALRRLLERGWQSSDPTRRDLSGLQDLMQRLQQRRRELLERYNLGDTLAGIRQELESIVEEERAGVQRRLDEASTPPRRCDRPTASRRAADGEADAPSRSPDRAPADAAAGAD